MKRILVISFCSVRSSGRGLTSDFLHTIDLGREESIVDVFDISMKNHNRNDYKCTNYYSITTSPISKVLSRYKVTRLFWNEFVIGKELNSILQKNTYDLVILFQLPRFSDRLVSISKKNNVKTGLYPWGSDILRCRTIDSLRLKMAFRKCDYILGYEGSVALRTCVLKYNADPNKIIKFSLVVSGVQLIQKLNNKLSRKEMHEALHIPYSNYNIICGYNADPGQQHLSSIAALSCVKERLPEDYQIIFPVSYGDRNGYIDSLKKACETYGLNSFFIESYISDEQMALLHLITDLYINNQKTDNGNAFLVEALSCGNCIISGSWLLYTQFEDYGIPYYQFESQKELGNVIKSIIEEDHPTVSVPNELIKDLQSRTIGNLKNEWSLFFKQL